VATRTYKKKTKNVTTFNYLSMRMRVQHRHCVVHAYCIAGSFDVEAELDLVRRLLRLVLLSPHLGFPESSGSW
jgi:hypothetical protein